MMTGPRPMDDDPRVTQSEDAGTPLDELCDLVLERHHAYVHGAIPMIRAALAQLAERDGPPWLPEVRAAFSDLADQLTSHLLKEEAILFPAMAALAQADREGKNRPPLPFPTVLHPIRMMESEHARIAGLLEQIRLATSGFIVPDGAPESWHRAVRALARFDEAMQAHLHAENDVLFPRALELERHLP